MGENTATLERGKIDPVSTKEFWSRDRNARNIFIHSLPRPEQNKFAQAAWEAFAELPLKDRREISDARVKRLAEIPHKTLGQQVEYALEKASNWQLHLPAREPIFLRKVQYGVNALRRKFAHHTSPYLIR